MWTVPTKSPSLQQHDPKTREAGKDHARTITKTGDSNLAKTIALYGASNGNEIQKIAPPSGWFSTQILPL
jgi:hypothetical protein